MFDRLRPPQQIFQAQSVKWPERPNQNWFLTMWIVSGGTFFEFGSFLILLQYSETENFDLWTQSIWHNLCLSFNRETKFLSFFIDGKNTNVQTKLNHIKLDGLDFSFLDHFMPMVWGNSGSVTDINVWDYGLTSDEMKDWTFCK